MKVSKYRPLADYLHHQTKPTVELSFAEIEQIIGNELPPSAYARRWWSIGRQTSSFPLWQEAWRSAGYDALLIHGADRVEFRKLA